MTAYIPLHAKAWHQALSGMLIAIFMLTIYPPKPAQAIIPVIDEAQIVDWIQQLKDNLQELKDDLQFITFWTDQIHDMEQQIKDVEDIFTALTSMPADLINTVASLIDTAVLNPLINITQMINAMRTGGFGGCSAAGNIVNTINYFKSKKADFTAALQTGQIYRLGGIMACDGDLLNSSEKRLNSLPALLTELKACKTESCVTSVAAQISAHTAEISVHHEQATIINQQAQIYEALMLHQMEQKQRGDDEQIVSDTGGDNVIDVSSSPSSTSSSTNSSATSIAYTAPTFGQTTGN
jgi:hypothetical protein